MDESVAPERITVRPEPTALEMAAILAAFDELWPTPPAKPAARAASRWRFSGRWWVGDQGQRVPGRAWGRVGA